MMKTKNKVAIKTILSFLIAAAISLPLSVTGSGTIKVELVGDGGMIYLNGEPLINAPAGSTIVRYPNGTITVDMGGVNVMVPPGSTISAASPPGTLRVDLGASSGAIAIDGVRLATSPAGSTVLFNPNNTTVVIVPGGNGNTTITMPTSNGHVITDNGNGTITVILSGQAPITIDANGGNWYAVFFNSNGGSNVAAQIIESANPIITPANPTRAGYTFANWYSNAALTTVWNFGANTVSDITTLFARWEVEVPPPPPPPPPPPEEVPEVEVPTGTIPEMPTGDMPSDNAPTEEMPAEDTAPEDIPQDEDPYVELPEEEQEEQSPPTIEQSEPDEGLPANDAEPGTSADNADNEPNERNEDGEYTGDLSYENLPYVDLPYEDAAHQSPPPEEYEEYFEETEQTEQSIVQFTLTGFGNYVNYNVSNYRIVSRPLGLQFLYGQLPAFTNGEGFFYNVRYRTNLNNLHGGPGGIPASRPFTLLPPSHLGDDEIITDIIIEFAIIPAGFGIGDTITLNFLVLDEDNAQNHWDVIFGESRNRNFLIAAILNNIDEIVGVRDRYDTESWDNFQTVVNIVQVTLGNPNTTIEELEQAYVLLQQAIEELNPVEESASPQVAVARVITLMAMSVLFSILIFMLVKLFRYKKRTAVRFAG